MIDKSEGETNTFSFGLALDAAAVNNWTIVDMKSDWNKIFAFE